MSRLSRLTIFNAYNYYGTTACKRSLNASEKKFYDFCMDNHEIICEEDTEDNDPIIEAATKIYLDVE